MSYTVFLILFAVVLGLLGGIFNLPFWLIIAAIFGLSLIRIGYIYYIVQLSQNTKTIHAFLEKNKKQLVYEYVLAIGNGSVTEQRRIIDAILKKYPSQMMQATYKMNRALLERDYTLAMQEIQPITEKPLGQYCIAMIYALQGKHEQALQIPLKHPWQKALVETIIAHNEQAANYEDKKMQAISLSRGIQRYINTYFLRDLEQQNEAV
ncbi:MULTISPECIES: hypothetical protein [Metasolibacillus]|uniref:hypothetical protein n=1 Tax=Metasolibacillus TaxID=2703677 RepID=UPI000D3A7E73|nr:hypothetical protein [Metasolibacillus fluoroglycofenilyticus]